ncbi:hypothetical protein [Asanoa iriomotensis]|uniref:Uncharacterized protein n=1 Tax=Asanoa iriomotensis TaxID=234613 RepID=A0ABQ4C9W8_9ACTN|nr:hypothetical protein [Asanoa iriomotensis]GIF59570.1 hypothetical protein Air01nite_56650 [Asanoa iriomotensis]
MSGQLSGTVDYSSWTVLAVLAPAYKRAVLDEAGDVGTDDLLLEVSRRLGGKRPVLRTLEKPGAPRRAGQRDGSPIEGERRLAQPVFVAEALLRELTVRERSYSLIRRQVTNWPVWTDGVALALADAAVRSTAAGLDRTGDRELVVALLSGAHTRAAELLEDAGLDRALVLADIQSGYPHYATNSWTPGGDSLEMVGLAPTPAIVRLIMAPINKLMRRSDGWAAGVLVALEEEARRQAVRTGQNRVSVAHVVLAAASLDHQIALRGIPVPEQMAGAHEVLDRRGLAYAKLTERVAVGATSLVKPGTGWTPSGPSPDGQPELAPDAAAAVETMRGQVAADLPYSQALETLLDSASGSAATADLRVR